MEGESHVAGGGGETLPLSRPLLSWAARPRGAAEAGGDMQARPVGITHNNNTPRTQPRKCTCQAVAWS